MVGISVPLYQLLNLFLRIKKETEILSQNTFVPARQVADVEYVVVVGLSIPPFPREHPGQTLLSLKMIDSLHVVGRSRQALLLEKYEKDEGQIYYIS